MKTIFAIIGALTCIPFIVVAILALIVFALKFVRVRCTPLMLIRMWQNRHNPDWHIRQKYVDLSGVNDECKAVMMVAEDR